MKTIFRAIAVMLVLAFTASVFAACGSHTESAAGSEGSETRAATISEAGSRATADESTASEARRIDYSKPDITIEDGDYAAMEGLAKELQVGKNQGKVVKVTGISTRSRYGVKGSVLEDNGEGRKIGTAYTIIGADSLEAYPENDAKVELTGVVRPEENGISCCIEVPRDKIRTVTE